MTKNVWEDLVNDTAKEVSKGGYFRPELGENRVRVVGDPIKGYLDWDMTDLAKPNGKPIRTPLEKGKPAPLNPGTDKKPKIFWAMPVYDYKTETIKIWEITQGGIRDNLMGYIKDKDYGALTSYDIKITRSGAGLETEYQVIPTPPKPADAKVIQATMETVVNLPALFAGADPFATMPEINF